MEFANSVVTLIGNIFSCGLILAFLIGVIYGIRFMLQIKQQDKEEHERKKAKDELERKEAMKKRGLSSPDMADALALALYNPVVSDWSLEF